MAFSFCFDIKKFFLCMNNLFISRKGLIKRKIMRDKRRNHEIIGEYAYSAKAKINRRKQKVILKCLLENKRLTVMTLSFRTDRSGQTVQTQIRLLLEEQSDQGLHCLLFYLHLFDEIP